MKSAGKRILIIPEGWCEYFYAQELKKTLHRDKQRSITVEIPKPATKNNCDALINRAIRLSSKAKRDNNPYDALWIFLDHDNKPDISQLFLKLPKSSIRLAYSCICIEHWFLIHLEDNRQHYPDAEHAIRRLETLWLNEFRVGYHKTKLNHFAMLENFLPMARKRAKAIHDQAEIDGIPLHKRNPYFTLPGLFDYFQEL